MVNIKLCGRMRYSQVCAEEQYESHTTSLSYHVGHGTAVRTASPD